MADLDRQASLAVGRGVDYVTVLMGANDACTATTGAMTPVATYRRQLDAAVATLRGGLPNARILVLSVPDVEHLWRLFRDDDAANGAWETFRICQSMLARPRESTAADQTRRAAVSARIDAYNAELAAACAAVNDPGFERCRWDGGLLHDTAFTREQVSHLDFFHPSAAGQRELADRAWAIGFPFADTAAPQTTISGEAPDLTFAADEDGDVRVPAGRRAVGTVLQPVAHGPARLRVARARGARHRPRRQQRAGRRPAVVVDRARAAADRDHAAARGAHRPHRSRRGGGPGARRATGRVEAQGQAHQAPGQAPQAGRTTPACAAMTPPRRRTAFRVDGCSIPRVNKRS
jgi:lysophospholipase L1-like esterase